MPFASIINKPTNQSGLEFTASNFTGCVQEIVEDATQYALMPLYYVINTMTTVFNDLICIYLDNLCMDIPCPTSFLVSFKLLF